MRNGQRPGHFGHTVHTHIQRLHHKLAITNRAQLLIGVMGEFWALTACPDQELPAICAKPSASQCPPQH